MDHVILKKHRVADAIVRARHDGDEAARNSSVRLVRDGAGDVRGLEVVCACGDRIVLELDYDPTASPTVVDPL